MVLSIWIGDKGGERVVYYANIKYATSPSSWNLWIGGGGPHQPFSPMWCCQVQNQQAGNIPNNVNQIHVKSKTGVEQATRVYTTLITYFGVVKFENNNNNNKLELNTNDNQHFISKRLKDETGITSGPHPRKHEIPGDG